MKTIAYAVYCDDEIIDENGSYKTRKTLPLAIALSPRAFKKELMKEHGWEVKKVKITLEP